MPTAIKEGNLQAPTRHPLAWREAGFYDQTSLFAELERVFDLCHGCRRCNSLCNGFATLFDLVDNCATLEVDGVSKQDYWKVVDHCYLCDLCYQTKCPYTPPHEWNIDFPHLMLRAKAVRYRQGKVGAREKLLASTDTIGKIAGIPIVVNAVNAANRNQPLRKLLDKAVGVHPDARLPTYHRHTLRKRYKKAHRAAVIGADDAVPCERTTGRVAIFTGCYGNYNEPELVEHLIAVLRHNRLAVRLVEKEQCCAMPRLELGDLDAVDKARQANIPPLEKLIDAGWDVTSIVPSCVLMFRQELPLMLPQDAAVQKVARSIFDPFEYLMLRHKGGLLNTDFKQPLGKVAYHVACHQRVQKIGLKTRDCLALVPATDVTAIERCSGHDGTYGVKSATYATAKKIGAPVVERIKRTQADHYGSDCPVAGQFIAHTIADGSRSTHPISLLHTAYAI